MHPSLSDVLDRLDRSHADLRAAVDSITPNLRDHPPAADRWSVAGVLEHLALVEERLADTVAAKVAQERASLGMDDDGPPGLPPTVEAMLADRTARRIAAEPVQPRGLTWDAAWARADAARAAFRRLVSDAEGLALSRVVHEHPRFGALNVYQWGGFIAAHESRHAEQIREIGVQLRDSAASPS